MLVDTEPLPTVGNDAAETEAHTPPAPVALLAAPDDAPPTDPAPAVQANTGPAPARVAVAARWLPSTRQLANAVRLRMDAALGPAHEGMPFVPGLHTSMRQAFGLIVVVGLISGLSRMIWQWVVLARAGTVLPLAWLGVWSGRYALRFADVDAFSFFNQQVSGLAPRAPAWIAAGLNALGAWISLPMRLLALWIVYGLLVLLAAKLLGAGTTLPRLYAALGYAALPALLLILWPLPVVGLVVAPLVIVLALVAAQRAVRAATGLDSVRALMALLLPPVVALALWGLLLPIAVAWIW